MNIYNNPTLFDQIMGTFYGNCAGDAIGLLTEFMNREEAQKVGHANTLSELTDRPCCSCPAFRNTLTMCRPLHCAETFTPCIFIPILGTCFFAFQLNLGAFCLQFRHLKIELGHKNQHF
jgi:hypothetical protein